MSGQPGRASWTRYLTPDSRHRRLGLVCLGAGTSAVRVATLRPRTLDCYAVVLVTRGTGELRWGGRHFPIAAPTLFWLLPGVEHEYGPGSGNWDEWWALFDGAAARAYQDLDYVPRDDPLTPVADVAGLEVAFGALARACRPDDPDTDVQAAAALHQLILATRRCAVPDPVADTPVLAALLRHACRPVTIAAHARALGLTETALREATRRAAGCSPKEFVQRARLTRAKELLATTDLPVVAVAARTGYDDPAYFTRIFSRRVGMPPSRFREQERRAPAVATPASSTSGTSTQARSPRSVWSSTDPDT